MEWTLTPGTALRGQIRPPADKSISHRTAILGAIADGDSEIHNFLDAADTLATLRAVQKLGVIFETNEDGSRCIHGVGLHGLHAASGALDLGNSGTGMRLLAGLLAAQRFASELVGDPSLSRRPMRRVADPLTQLGARIGVAEDGTPPIRISGRQLHGARLSLSVSSAQVKSALLLAGLYADGPVEVYEPAPSRDHTERLLQSMGADLRCKPSGWVLRPARRLDPLHMVVPGDLSSAAFWLVAASLVPGSAIELPDVGVNPLRAGVLRVLEQMGARIDIRNRRDAAGEPLADLHVQSADLHGVRVDPCVVAAAIDEFPVLFVAAALADGVSFIRGAQELRVKESDRIGVMASALRAMGAEITEYPDGVDIVGGSLYGTSVDASGDHRCAMALAVAALAAQGETRILGCQNVDTSYPGFVADLRRLGVAVGTRRAA